MSGNVRVWYVKPIGAHTNQVLADMFNGGNSFDEGVVCTDGTHNLCKCTRDQLIAVIASKENLSLNYKLYCQQGKSLKTLGPIAPASATLVIRLTSEAPS